MNIPLQRVRLCNNGVPVDDKADGDVAHPVLSKLRLHFVEDLPFTLQVLESQYINFFFNLLRWNDAPRTSRIFLSQIATFSQF